MKYFYTSMFIALTWFTTGQSAEKVLVHPRVVTSGAEVGAPPSDAVILIGKDEELFKKSWVGKGEEGAPHWTFEDGVVTVSRDKGRGSLKTREVFKDIQLHLEWRSPKTDKKGQAGTNSGLFLMGRYEIQILNSYENETYPDGQAGAIYKQSIPLVNASRPQTVWQSYDIVFKAPRFNEDGSLKTPAYITAFHNGVLIQDNFAIVRPTTHKETSVMKAHGDGGISLQDHQDPVQFRNMWVRKLDQ